MLHIHLCVRHRAALEGRLPQPLPLGRLTVCRGQLSKSSQTRAPKGGLESWERSDRPT